MTLYAWKFLIQGDAWYTDPENPDRAYKGMMIVVVAPDDVRQAREAARLGCARVGMDTDWLRVVQQPVKIPLDIPGAVLGYAAL